MAYKYYTCDVFTSDQFGGNPLAVFPEASGLSTEQMQKIAQEFNYSETAFVFPAEQGNCRKVRIFTASTEVPFAGHPNIGTAFVLASTGRLGEFDSTLKIVFEEKAGLVPLEITRHQNQMISCELNAPETISFGEAVSVEAIAAALSLSTDEIITKVHSPVPASVGLPFVIVEVKGISALARIKVNVDKFDELLVDSIVPFIHVYTHSSDDYDIRARMFAPTDGVPEDPATGSANSALAGLLAYYSLDNTGSFKWRIAQGIEMGRPSLLIAKAEKRDGRVETTSVGGSCVMMSEGHFYLN